MITIDGTKIKANASMDQNRGYREIVTEILREAEETDGARMSSTATVAGMSCLSRCASPRAAGRRFRTRSGGSRSARVEEAQEHGGSVEVDPERSVTREGGGREWFREGRRELERHREREGRPIPRNRDDRLFEAARRLEENHRVDLAADEAYERWRATAGDTLGRCAATARPTRRPGCRE